MPNPRFETVVAAFSDAIAPPDDRDHASVDERFPRT
jgi:hypothetical protein